MHFLLCFSLLLYFWYFYYAYSRPLPKPLTKLADPQAFHLQFVQIHHHHFQYRVNNVLAWEHVLHDPSSLVHPRRIIPRNDCYPYTAMAKIAAKGLGLYKYLLDHPDRKEVLTIEEESPFSPHQLGDVFYFTCQHRDIVNLQACPSGTFFQNEKCIAVSSCTGQPDYAKLPIHTNIYKYVECKNNREFIKECKPEHFFYHDRCIREKDLNYYCKLYDTVVPIKLDRWTLFECLDHKPVRRKCPPGTEMFEGSHLCEPTDCVGFADDARVPLPLQSRGPFQFIPGYMICLNQKVSRTVECPSNWDHARTRGDNLTLLPMVFSGQECAIPTFCENVFSDQPDVRVPVHEFTKDVPNWQWSDSYDRSAGYSCTGGHRKRESLDPGYRINKRFKSEKACTTGMEVLSIDGRPGHYYDCNREQSVACPPGEFFDGKRCKVEPPNAFKYRDVPLFHFEPLNSESWIKPWNYWSHPVPPICQNADYFKLYNTCIQPECAQFPFLSMVPGLKMLLPRHERSQCRFDASDRHVKKEPVAFNYTFWDQQILMEKVNRADACTFGQKIHSGNFIWDSTVYATCDETLPFIFCPSTHTQGLVRVNNVPACAPPLNPWIRHTETAWTSYATNEVKRIRSTSATDITRFHLNRKDAERELLPGETFDVAQGTVLTLHTSKPVDLELGYRVTHPPNVAFKYPLDFRVADSTHGFIVSHENFTQHTLAFPTYTPQVHVDAFMKDP